MNDDPVDPPRLKPDMASQRLLVLDFVRAYIARWGGSPSYGEICAGLLITRTRARHAIKSLAADGLLLRTPGPRGITLPSVRDRAVRQLRALGWEVDEDDGRASPKTTLLPPAELVYRQPGSAGDGTDEAQRNRPRTSPDG